jgi:CheY-like chemotaxis protein
MSFHQDREEFCQQVSDALKHLYDYPYLEKHPLALQYWPDIQRTGPSRAQQLSRFLLESLEALNPPDQSYKGTSRAQYYTLLAYRYVEERPLEDIMRELGYSRRQFFREQRKAIAMLAALLREKLPEPPPSPTAFGTDTAEPQERDSQPETLPTGPSDLLDAEAERFLAQRQSVDIGQVVQGALQVVGQLADQRGVTLTDDLGLQLPPVYTSRTLIRQVFLRALSNLIAQPGAQRVRIQARHEGQRVVVELTAEPGPPDPHDKTEDTRVRELEYVQRLVEMMGGDWQGIEARPGSCICRFDFPVKSHKLLLVVEDNEAVIKAFRRYLTSYDYQVIGTATGAEAIQLARELNPTAITLDVMMPTQDGWEVLQELKSDPLTQYIPVIICSVLENPELARSLGAVAYLRKPVTQSDLLDVLDSLDADPDDGTPTASRILRR